MQILKNLSFYYFLLFCYISFCIIGVIYFPNGNDPDAMSHLLIVKQCLNGNWNALLNGYWSFFTNLLLIPFSFIFGSDILAFKMQNFFLAWITVFYFYHICIKINFDKTIIKIATISFAFVISNWSVFFLTSDILFLLTSLYFFNNIINKELFKNHWLIAAYGLLLFFSKSYGIYFFLVELFVVVCLFIFFKKKICFKKLFKGLALYTLVIIAWGFMLKTNYKSFTISEATKYNNYITKKWFIQHPTDTMPIIKPSEIKYNFFWVDITKHLEDSILRKNNKTFTAFNSKMMRQNGLFFYQLINTKPRYSFYIYFLPFFLIIFFNKKNRLNHLIILGSILSMASGYFLFFFEFRYLLFCYVLSFIGIIYLYQDFLQHQKSYIKWIFYILVVYSFTKFTFDNYYFRGNKLLNTETVLSNYFKQKKSKIKTILLINHTHT